ncbi:MAG: hypothetical protein JRE47_01625 [Deltaproteobacteria bacterium]|nr:hypothetical protein [Deltaproteobacteria bacterium]
MALVSGGTIERIRTLEGIPLKNVIMILMIRFVVFEFVEFIEDISPDMTIITYCKWESCKLSHVLVLFLDDMGFKHIRMLINGWSVWQNINLPVGKKDKALS